MTSPGRSPPAPGARSAWRYRSYPAWRRPDAQDRIFATQCGVEAARACLKGQFGFMVAQRAGKMVRVPLEDVAGKLQYVDPDSDLVREAKLLGISFGDE